MLCDEKHATYFYHGNLLTKWEVPNNKVTVPDMIMATDGNFNVRCEIYMVA
jgi:hypothetical protein